LTAPHGETSDRPTARTDPTGPHGPKRPNFGVVIVAGIAFAVGLTVLRRVAESTLGPVAGSIVALVALGVLVGSFRLFFRWRRSRGDDEDFSPERVRKWVHDSALPPPAFAGDGTLTGAPMLVMSQRTKAVEAVTEYGVFDHGGGPLATITQVGQSAAKKVMRVLFWFDIFMTHRFEVRSAGGALLGGFVRPRKVLRSRVELHDAVGRPVGVVRQENIFFHIRFRLELPDGTVVGRMRAENWRAWDFTVTDEHGEPVARMIKAWEGYARTMLTTADRFVIAIHRPLAEPLRTLTVAGALAVDVALKQDSRGLNSIGP
jgi:uncharacterized protein YxjI